MFKPRRQKRPSRRTALRLWHEVTLGSVLEDGPDLTTRQFAILTTIYLETGPHTVRSLAVRLNVTKAVITRALDTLSRYRFVARTPDPRDRRSVVIRQTGPGSAYLTHFAEQIQDRILPDKPNFAEVS